MAFALRAIRPIARASALPTLSALIQNLNAVLVMVPAVPPAMALARATIRKVELPVEPAGLAMEADYARMLILPSVAPAALVALVALAEPAQAVRAGRVAEAGRAARSRAAQVDSAARLRVA